MGCIVEDLGAYKVRENLIQKRLKNFFYHLCLMLLKRESAFFAPFICGSFSFTREREYAVKSTYQKPTIGCNKSSPEHRLKHFTKFFFSSFMKQKKKKEKKILPFFSATTVHVNNRTIDHIFFYH